MSAGRVLLTLLVLALAACSSRVESPPPSRAFYYWRTVFALSPAERAALANLGVDKLYVRMFDVEWNAAEQAPRLIGKLTVDKSGSPVPPGIEVVPVVFLRQDVFQKLDARGGATLAKQLSTEVTHRMKRLGVTARELQLDCDWTERSRERFFGFVRDVERESKLALSSTIRLHQVKYRERTGVPPVGRGMLMFYNMGKFSADPADRAIFDEETAEHYLSRIADYPLPLDVALPIWSWTVHVRDDRVIDLLQSTDPDELPRQDFLIPGGLDRYVATRTAFFSGTLLRGGDVLKIERMGPADSRAAAELLAPHLATGARSVALFDLSERNLQRHATTLDQLYDATR